MKIVSTTIAGPGSEAGIARALDSVGGLVDEIVVLANGSPDEIDRIVLAVQRGTVPVVFDTFPWTHDFSAARNLALGFATARGADWCLWIDTDEWFEYDVQRARDFRTVLSTTDRGALNVYHASRSYCQPRAIRLPTSERWAGKTHECFAAFKVGQGTLDGLTFNEWPKTPEQLKAKFERDREILTGEVERDPTDARSWFYLGETLNNLGDKKGAVVAYDLRASLGGWNEESAWACYRAAECLSSTGEFERAIPECARGLALHAGMPELAWLAGWCNWKLGRHAQAVHWSLMAAAGGEYEGGLRGTPERIGFRHVPALWEAPFDVLRHAYRGLGMTRAAGVAELKFQAALRMREQRRTPLGRQPAPQPLTPAEHAGIGAGGNDEGQA